MPFKFCPRATTSVAIAAAGLLAAPLPLPAQEAASLQKRPSSSPEDYVHIRFWNMLPPPGPTLSAEIPSEGDNGPVVLSAEWLDFTGYTLENPGKQKTVKIRDSETGEDIETVKIPGKKGRYFTILARPRGSGMETTVIEDTYIYDAEGRGRVAVYQFAPGFKVAASGPDGNSKEIPYGESAVFENLPKQSILSFDITRLADGKTGRQTLDLDFTDSKRVSCLFLLDRYERMCFRTVSDGYVFDLPLPPEEEPLTPPASPR